MCHKCEQKSQLHLAYLKQRGLPSISNEIPNHVAYDLLIKIATLSSKALISKITKGNAVIEKGDISHFSLVTEKRALDFAEQHLGRIHLEKDAAISKEIEKFRAALTLIQSKALLSGDSTIEKIARDALEAQEYKFSQSSEELKAMLDSAE